MNQSIVDLENQKVVVVTSDGKSKKFDSASISFDGKILIISTDDDFSRNYIYNFDHIIAFRYSDIHWLDED